MKMPLPIMKSYSSLIELAVSGLFFCLARDSKRSGSNVEFVRRVL